VPPAAQNKTRNSTIIQLTEYCSETPGHQQDSGNSGSRHVEQTVHWISYGLINVYNTKRQ